MKIRAIKQGSRAPIPLRAIVDGNQMWTFAKAPQDGFIISMDPTDSPTQGSFVSLLRMKAAIEELENSEDEMEATE